MGEVIVVPFGLAYKEVASAVAKSGYDAVYNTLIDQGFDATVGKALSRGWGS